MKFYLMHNEKAPLKRSLDIRGSTVLVITFKCGVDVGACTFEQIFVLTCFVNWSTCYYYL